MESIRIGEDAMRKRADQLHREARTVGAVMQDLGSLSESLRTEWAGEESASFAEWYYREFRPRLIDGQHVIGKFAHAIGECADELAANRDEQAPATDGSPANAEP